MADSKHILESDGGQSRVSVERAVSDLRAGRPVVIQAGRSHLVVIGVEALDEGRAIIIERMSKLRSRLLLPAPRLRRLGLDRIKAGAVALPTVDLGRIRTLALEVGARVDAPVAALGKLDHAALELARIALIAPTVVVATVSARAIEGEGLIRVEAAAIEGYRASRARDMRIVTRAPVPLEGATETEFVVFRGGEGLRDQVAVLIGKPDLSQPVIVRLHSACLTGDLFGSLKCDCGDQLRTAVQHMAQNGGGVLLYLDQEGRGNGIANKIGAYRLQAQGFDTYDADETLGFDHDHREFNFAAAMLKQLGVSRVRLLTNNPAKIAALVDAGLDVVSHQRILGRTTEQNVRYLASKRERSGHLLDADEAPESGGAAE